MPHRSNSGSANQAMETADARVSLLSESEYTSMNERVNILSKEADDVRAKIQELDKKYETTKMTAKQHDKLVKQYLLKLFDVNRELLPLKERMQRDAEEREKLRIREKLGAVGTKAEPRRRRRKAVTRRASAAKVKHKKKNARR